MAEPGRPTLYRPEYDEQAFNYCLLGATDEEMAGFFDVDVRTFHRWKEAHLSFCHSLREGRDLADSKIAKSLYQKALDGDTTSMIFWLKNRVGKRWRDRQADDEVKTQPINVMIKNFTGKEE